MRKKKTGILEELTGYYWEKCLLSAAMSLVAGIVFLVAALCTENGKPRFYTLTITCPLMVCIAVFCTIKAFAVYYPLYQETKNIRQDQWEERRIYIKRIRKIRHIRHRDASFVSVYTVYFQHENGVGGRYHYIPQGPGDTDLGTYKKKTLSVRVYQGTNIIQSYPQKDKKKSASYQQMMQEAKERATGLWAEVIEAFEKDMFSTMWQADISVDHCHFDGNMLDIALNKNGTDICFNMDADSLYVCYPPSDQDRTWPLTKFADMDALLCYLQTCTETIPLS